MSPPDWGHSPSTVALIRSLSRIIAKWALGSDDPRLDALAAHLAHVALSYGRSADW